MRSTTVLLVLAGFCLTSISAYGLNSNNIPDGSAKLDSLQKKNDELGDRALDGIDKCLQLLQKADNIKDKLKEKRNEIKQKMENSAYEKDLFECRLKKPKLCKGKMSCKKRLQLLQNKLNKYDLKKQYSEKP